GRLGGRLRRLGGRRVDVDIVSRRRRGRGGLVRLFRNRSRSGRRSRRGHFDRGIDSGAFRSRGHFSLGLVGRHVLFRKEREAADDQQHENDNADDEGFAVIFSHNNLTSTKRFLNRTLL